MLTDSPSTVETDQASTPAPASAEAQPSAPQPSANGDVSGSSSPASGESPTSAETRESLLDVVRKAAPQKERQPVQDDQKGVNGRGASPAPSAQPGEDLGPVTQTEMDGYHPRTKKRIQQLLADNDGLRKQIEPLKARADTTEQLQNFLKQSDIAKEDFGLVLDLAAAMRRGDFKTFLEGVGPYVKLAQESLGITLPPDLAQAVRQGRESARGGAVRYS